MDSCFPHLTILNPRNTNKSRDEGCNVEDTRIQSRTPTLQGKNDIFQDLDLYYVRQIARNSKVGFVRRISKISIAINYSIKILVFNFLLILLNRFFNKT